MQWRLTASGVPHMLTGGHDSLFLALAMHFIGRGSHMKTMARRCGRKVVVDSLSGLSC